MATVSNTPECSICYEAFKTPKFIPCGHTFCLGCIERYVADKRKTFPCPICQQNVKVPEGGAKMFTTNFIVQPSKHTSLKDQPRSTTPKCPNHNQKEVDYYCNNCNVGLCLKCIFNQHKDHETLDIECDETRNKAIEKLQRSQNSIQNRIKHLEKTRTTLLESFEHLKYLCEDSCAKVLEKTEQIVSDLRESCIQIIQDIRGNLEENRNKVEDREKEITSEINVLESDMVSNISPSTSTTLNLLLTFPRLLEIEKLDESRKDYNLCVQYLQWVGKNFNLGIDQLGSVIPKSFYILGSYQFLFADSVSVYHNSDTFRNNNLVWSCGVDNFGYGLLIGMRLSPDDNPKLNYCIIDGRISLLNIEDDSKTKTKTYSGIRLENGSLWSWLCPITWSELTDTSNGYLTSNGQFVIQFDIKQIREISWK